jgi:lysozyme
VANENMSMSAQGLVALRHHEGAVMRHYNDAAGNCTFGVGTLLHHGRCNREEIARPVTEADVNRQLGRGVAAAEGTVRQKVRAHALTQAQFDALVSFVYNTGPTGAAAVLAAANRGETAQVAALMGNYVFIHPRGPNGRRRAPVRAQGLVTRRNAESAPFANAAEPAPEGR